MKPAVKVLALSGGVGGAKLALGLSRSVAPGELAVLVNTGIASAGDPVVMARAFRLAVEAGRTAREAGLGAGSDVARPTSPLTGFLD